MAQSKLFSPSLILLYLASFFNFLAIALVLVATISLICEKIGGSATAVNAQTAFVTVTSYFIMNSAKLVFSKFDAALSDHVGRKPILVASCLAFIISRGLVLSATDASLFYLAALTVGSVDVFYAVCVAYISDLLTGDDAVLRGKAFGIQAGLAIGLGFTIGVPVGAVLQDKYSLQTPFYSAIISSFASIVCIIAVPSSDVKGLVYEDKVRRFPSDWKQFIIAHHPLSGFGLILRAKLSPLDWLSNFCGQVAQQLLQSTFILFVEGALGYTPPQAGEAFAIIGLSIALFSPLLIGRYEERGLISLGQCVQILGYLFLSLAGAPDFKAGPLAIPGFLFLAVGSVWQSAMPSILTKQYDETEYGSVVGVMTQQAVCAVIPAYPLSLLFSYTMQSNSTIKWPGFVWVFAAFFLLASIFVQIHAHPNKALTLVKRAAPATVAPDEDENKDPIPPTAVVVNPLIPHSHPGVKE